MTLQSVEGTHFHARRLVLAAVSEPLAILLNDSFGDCQGGVIALEASSVVIDVLLRCIYEGSADIPLESCAELLCLSHLYALGDLQARLVKTIQENLTSSIALQILTACQTLGLDCLQERCEE